ncbi:MAG: acyl-CoA dehydrogenase family protein [Hyphomonadaceae bacterium]
MDFEDSPNEASYRAAARAWIEKHGKSHVSPAKDSLSAITQTPDVVRAREWQALKASAGYSCITLDRAWGGGGGSHTEAAIFADEEARAGIDYGIAMTVAHGMAVPTILAKGSAALQERFVRPTVRGEMIWCQLFSEPSGGSDVAAARTRAVRDGDDWVVNGQKIWTSGAQFSDYGLLLARTNPDAPKHKGLTMFAVNMKDPAVEVRPIHQMNGGFEFNEVFFKDLRVSDADRIGEIGDGWAASIVTLMNERYTVGRPIGPSVQDVIALARQIPGRRGSALEDRDVREKVADAYLALEGLNRVYLRVRTALSRGQTPGPENSICKLIAASQMQSSSNEAVAAMDQFGLIDDAQLAPFDAFFQQSLLLSAGVRIAGGTDEVLRNIIAERVLGLPADIRVDKNAPFNAL